MNAFPQRQLTRTHGRSSRFNVSGALLALAFVAMPLAAQVATAPATPENSFGSWIAKCEDATADTQGGCFIFQNLVLREGGQRVLQVAVGYVPSSQEPIALVSLPLGISLPPGVAVELPDAQPIKFAVERCEPNGCRAGFKLNEKTLERLKSAAQMTVKFFDAQRRPIEVAVSLAGFTEGLASLKTGAKR